MANLISFLGGMAQGGLNQWRYQDHQDRQDRAEMRQEKLDVMREKEFDLRKRQLEGELGDKEKIRADEQELRDTAKAVEPVKTWSQSTVGKTPTDVQAMAEQMSSGQGGTDGEIAGKAEYEVGSGASAKFFPQNSGGLAAATKEASMGNTEEAQMDRYVNKLKAQGKHDEAMKYQANSEILKEKLNSARLSVVTNAGLGFIQEGNYLGLVDAYNKHYKDGRTATYEPGANGAGVISIYQGDPKDGKRVGEMRFDSKDDASTQFMATMNPMEAHKQRQAMELERAKAHNDDLKFTSRERFKADLRGERGGSSGSSGAGGRGKDAGAAETPEAIMLGMITTANKDGEVKMSPAQHGVAKEFGTRFLVNNPGLSPSLAASAAMTHAADPTPLVRSFDSENWIIRPAIQEPVNGKILFAGGSLAPQEADKAAYADGIKSVMEAMKAKGDGTGEMFLAAAKGDAASDKIIHNGLVDKKVAAIQADPRFASTPIATIKGLAIREVGGYLANRYALIRKYQPGMMMDAPGSPSRTKPAPAPAAVQQPRPITRYGAAVERAAKLKQQE